MVTKLRKSAGRPVNKSAGTSRRQRAAEIRPVEAEEQAALPDEQRRNKKPKPTDKAKSKKNGKVVRDSFTMPAGEYEQIRALKKRCLTLGMAVKKSELLRAGLGIVGGLPDTQLAQVVAAVVSVKSGRRPKKARKEA